MSLRQKIRNFAANRKAVRELNALDDRSLDDIGLVRAGIREAVIGR